MDAGTSRVDQHEHPPSSYAWFDYVCETDVPRIRPRSFSLPCLVLAALALVMAVPQRAAAQVLYGSILGDVKDSSGALVPGAAIVVTNREFIELSAVTVHPGEGELLAQFLGIAVVGDVFALTPRRFLLTRRRRGSYSEFSAHVGHPSACSGARSTRRRAPPTNR
jgi:hypothetical protein